VRYNDLRSEASRSHEECRIPLLSRAVIMLFANLSPGLVLTSRMYRFSFGQKKIIVRGISTIRAISQWAGITSDRPGIESGTSQKCVDDEITTRLLFGMYQIWISNTDRFISRHCILMKAHIDFLESKTNYSSYSKHEILQNHGKIFYNINGDNTKCIYIYIIKQFSHNILS